MGGTDIDIDIDTDTFMYILGTAARTALVGGIGRSIGLAGTQIPACLPASPPTRGQFT